MTEDPRSIIDNFREQGLMMKALLIERQIQTILPTLFQVCGYHEGTYQIVSMSRITSQEGECIELEVTLSGSPEKMQNLATGLCSVFHSGASVELMENTLIFRKLLS